MKTEGLVLVENLLTNNTFVDSSNTFQATPVEKAKKKKKSDQSNIPGETKWKLLAVVLKETPNLVPLR